MITTPSTENRLIGRYYLRWNHITDRYKANARWRRTKGKSLPPADIIQPVVPTTMPSVQPTTVTAAVDPTVNIVGATEPKITKSKSRKKQKPHDNHNNIEKLVELEEQSREVLFKANTVVPFTLFPHTIILDRNHLTVIHRAFFAVAKITSVRFEDILTADLHVGPFFGSLKIATRFFINQTTEQVNSADMEAPAITFLSKRNAMEAHKLLQGLIAVTQKKIDISQIPKQKLVEQLRSLGANDDTRHKR